MDIRIIITIALSFAVLGVTQLAYAVSCPHADRVVPAINEIKNDPIVKKVGLVAKSIDINGTKWQIMHVQGKLALPLAKNKFSNLDTDSLNTMVDRSESLTFFRNQGQEMCGYYQSASDQKIAAYLLMAISKPKPIDPKGEK